MDRNKIIECLEKETIANKSGYMEIPLPLYSEVLALLKEQETMPIKDDKHWTQFKCPRCNAPLQRTTFFKMDTRFCKYCGQEVKFE